MPGSVAGFSPLTQQALNATAERAVAGSPLVAAAGQSLNNLMTPGTAPGNAALQGLLNGYSDPGNAYTQAGAGSNPLLNAAAGAGMGLGALGLNGPNTNPGAIANSISASAVNPYLGQMFAAAAAPVSDAVNAQFEQAGRAGSGANQQELTRNLGDLAANIYGGNFLGEQNLGLNAATAAQNLGLNAYNAQANALNSAGNLLSGIGQNQAARQLQAGSQLSSDALNQANIGANAATALNSQFNTGNNLQLAAAGLAPQLAAQDYTDLQNLLNVGGAYDALNQNVLNNQLQQWQYAQAQPWNILNAYGGAITGLGALGGTSSGSSSQTVPGQSLIPSLIGGGLSLANNPLSLFGTSLW
jgi:hypothetical protein